MKLYYYDLSSKYYVTGRGWLYDRKGTLIDTKLPRPLPPLVCQLPQLVTLWSEMDATSQIGQEGRDSILDNIHSALTGIDIILNRQREQANSHVDFVYKKYEKIDNMNIEELETYKKGCRNGWKYLISHEKESVGSICVNG